MENDIENIEDSKRVFTDKKNFTLQLIKEKFDDGDIIPQPDYQRDYVYDTKKASKLIESVLMEIPIPTIYLCEENDSSLSIIDGQQRMTSIVKYLKNEFALTGLEELGNLNGKKFSELKKPLQRTIKDTTLDTIVLTKESQKLKYEIFARLNQGSVALKPQELRNCIYRGSFNNMLEDIAKTNKTLPILFVTENRRKNYQEYILRFFALKQFNDYSSSLKQTMNDYMSKHQNDNEETIEENKKLFNSTIDIIKQVLGDDAFKTYDRQGKRFLDKFGGSIYDSIIVPFSMFNNHDLMTHADEIRNKINDIKENNLEYQDFTYAASGSKNRVIGRIIEIYNSIKSIIGSTPSKESDRIFDVKTKEDLWHDGYICSYCGQTILNIEDVEIDHKLPYSKGGLTSDDNAQLLHRHCNREKYNNIDSVDFENEENSSTEDE